MAGPHFCCRVSDVPFRHSLPLDVPFRHCLLSDAGRREEDHPYQHVHL